MDAIDGVADPIAFQPLPSIILFSLLRGFEITSAAEYSPLSHWTLL
jgi:hypothetical protein